MNKFSVVDNFLDPVEFLKIKKEITSHLFPWYYIENVTGIFDDKDFYFIHKFFHNHFNLNSLGDEPSYEVSDKYDIIVPILKKINIDLKNLLRVKANCYPNTFENIHHKSHVDYDSPVLGAIFYINENNGPTIIDNVTEVFPKENRILFFDSSLPHHSVTCTDANVRININFNFS